MVNYANSKIYKITCNVTGLTYYGSTVNPLSKRMGHHRCIFKTNRRGCKSKLVLAAGDYDYCLVEKWPCADKSELHQRERFYIESNECVNKQVPGRTRKEYKAAHKEEISEYMKEYQKEHYSSNKEKMMEQMKEYYLANKEAILKYQKEYNAQYRANHKDAIEAKKSVKVTCDCGCSVRKGYISQHKKTQKHINLMSQNEQSV